jgi:hypothetical protein
MAGDAPALEAIFNAHLEVAICPYVDRTKPWTIAYASRYLDTYNGTLLLERGGVAVGFIGFIDYANPATTSSIVQDAAPEISILALDFKRLPTEERLPAAKRLAAAAGRDLQRMGFSRCRAVISARAGFHQAIARAMSTRCGGTTDEAMEVMWGIEALQQLVAEGF